MKPIAETATLVRTSLDQSRARRRFATELRAAAQLEIGAIRRSRWPWVFTAAYALIGIVLMTAGGRESALLGFTGTSRVLLSLSNVLVVAIPLVALIATAPVVQRARDDGSLELLLSQPLSPGAWFVAAFATRYVALVLPLGIVFAAIGLWGFIAHADPMPWTFGARALAVSAALAFAFAGIGACISVFARDAARVITYLVLTWVVAIALVDFGLIGMLLRWRVEPHVVFGLAAANPVESARLALVSHLQPDLASFGPVGFYLATRLGSSLLFALGIIWPATVGVISFALAYLGFCRTDRV